MGRQHDVGDGSGCRQCRGHDPRAGPQRRPEVGVEHHGGAGIARLDDGAHQLAARPRREDRHRDAREIHRVGAHHRRLQRLDIVCEQFRRRLPAPIGEMPVAFFLVDHVEPGPPVGDGLDPLGTYPGLLDERPHLARIHVVAERRDIVDVPALRQQGPCVPGGVERVAGVAKAVHPAFAARHFDHGFADTHKPFGHAVFPSTAQCLCRGYFAHATAWYGSPRHAPLLMHAPLFILPRVAGEGLRVVPSGQIAPVERFEARRP